MNFDKRQTNIAKGVGLLLLLWHHLFYNTPEKYSLFISLFIYKSIPIESFIADFCKVCVAIFLILSGYGLTKSYEKYNSAFVGKENGIKHILKRDTIYIKNRWLQLMSNYWFVFIIFVPISYFFGRKFYLYYGTNPLNYLFDFFGISYLIHNNLDCTMNPT